MKAFYAVLFFAAFAGVVTCLFEKEYFFVGIKLPWTEAQKYCRENYADLPTIKNKGDIMKLKNVGSVEITSWIGLSKKPDEAVYSRWSDEANVIFTKWAANEPVYPEQNHCVAVYHSEYYALNCLSPLMFFCYAWVPKIIVVPSMMDWEESLKYCRNNYNDLISINTEEDVFAINRTLINETSSLWTGLCSKDGLWFWVNQEEIVDLAELGGMLSLPSCPAKPFRCGDVSTGVALNSKDCSEKMKFICY